MKIQYILLLVVCFTAQLHAQTLNSAFSIFDSQLDEWKIHIDEELYIEARRQMGSNPYHKWELSYDNEEGETLSGHLELKWPDNFSYWDGFWNNERISIEMIHFNDLSSWRIRHNDKTFTIRATTNMMNEWQSRFGDKYRMYQVDEFDLRDWYIDDETEEELTFPMRIAIATLLIELKCFVLNR